MKRFILRLIITLIVLPSAVFAAIYSLNRNGFFNLDKIEIVVEKNGDHPQFINPKLEVLQKKLEAHKGQSLWDLNLGQLMQKISPLPWADSIRFSRRWPSTLQVLVAPKEIKLVYLNRMGQIHPLVEGGDLLEPVTVDKAPNVSVLEGENFERNKELRQKALKTIKEIPNQGRFSQQSISEIRYDKKEGFWMTLIEDGIRVKLGEENIPLKAARVSQVIEYMENRELEARVIDANLSKKVLVRLRKDP